MRLLSTTELKGIGLTEPQFDLIRRAYPHERHSLGLLGVQSRTLDALRDNGYIKREARYSDDEIRTLREQQSAEIGIASSRLKEGHWQIALVHLKKVQSLEDRINQTELRLTIKAINLLREFAE